VKVYHYNLAEEFEFSARMPEEFFVKAMNSTRPLFITDDFLARIAATSPEDVVRELVRDLKRDEDPNATDDVLRWYYLFMDFNTDFPRLMSMYNAQEGDSESLEAGLVE
jgi:hypothetical protein